MKSAISRIVAKAFQNRKTIFLLLICFLVANLQAFLLNYSHIISVEQPILDEFNSAVMDTMLDAWATSFVSIQMKDLAFFSNNYDCKSTECFEDYAEKEYFSLMNNETYAYGLNKTKCFEALDKKCLENASLQHCTNNTLREQTCLLDTLAQRSLGLTITAFGIQLTEVVNSINDDRSGTIDYKIGCVLNTAFVMAVAAIKTARFSNTLTDEVEKCYELYNESNLTDLEVAKICSLKPQERFEKMAEALKKNVTYLEPLPVKDCAYYNILKVSEKWRLEEQGKLNKSGIPVLQLSRLIDTFILNECSQKGFDAAKNHTPCIKARGFVLTQYAIAETMISAATQTACLSQKTAQLKEYFEELDKNGME